MLIFQKAMEKMDRIMQKKNKMEKEKESKTVEPTKPKILDHHFSRENRVDEKKRSSTLKGNIHMDRSERPRASVERMRKDHLQAKMRL